MYSGHPGHPSMMSQTMPAYGQQRSPYPQAMQAGAYSPGAMYGQMQGQQPIRAPVVQPQAMPLTPKVQSAVPSNVLDQSQHVVAIPVNQMASFDQRTGLGKTLPTVQVQMNREQVLEQRVRDLEMLVNSKDEQIKDLHAAIGSKMGPGSAAAKKVRSPGRSGSGFRKVTNSKPVIKYSAVDQDDPVDVRLEEFYNSTGSAVQFRRINRGFYRFGDSIVELDIINHKLMSRTEDGWNRGKFGPIEKFLMYYENIEREKAGMTLEA